MSRELVAIRGPVVRKAREALWSRPVLALGTLLGLATIAELTPGLQPLRLFGEAPAEASQIAPGVAPPVLEVGEATLQQETESRPDLVQSETLELPQGPRGPIAKKQAQLPPIDIEKPPVALEDARGDSLSGFFAALERSARKESGAVTRVAHFGDSIVVSDYVSGTLRRLFQDQFGDAGHGYMLVANAWPAYFHNDVYRFASAGWMVSRIVGPLSPDGIYGLGGVSFRAPPGARSRFGTARSGKRGRAASRFIISYLEQPGGGTLRINLDGKEHSKLSTEGDTPRVKELTIEVPDGEHELELLTLQGNTRAFGVVMERDAPGVVWDAIGVQGARIRFLDKQNDQH